MKLQDYLTGYIDKTPDGQYSFVNKGEVQGTYPTIADLVKAHGKTSTKRTRRSSTNSKTAKES